MQTYYALLFHGGKPSQFGESKHSAKDINTFRKRWVGVYKNSHGDNFRMRVWNNNRLLGDLFFRGDQPFWEDAQGKVSPIDEKTGKLRGY